MSAPALKQSNEEPVSGLDRLTYLHKALADSLRLQILRLLRSESFGVLELCRILDIRQSALSHHLKILATAELVSTRREGNSIFYRRSFLTDGDPYRDLKEAVFLQVDALELIPAQLKKIKQVQMERSQLSLNFFNKNAAKFREQQGLIVENDDYHNTLHTVLDGLGLTSDMQVLEVGPGEGQLLSELAAKFDTVTGLDNSMDMLDRSEQALNAAGISNVTLIHGDTAVARKQKLRGDLIIFDMVLHHISSPAKTFKDCAALLNPGGSLLIVELSPHDQDWVRESCGDLWLGFEESELEHWASKAGLQSGQSLFLGLRNGFQIQIRVFQKNDSL